MVKNEIEKLLIAKSTENLSAKDKHFIDDLIAFKRKDPNHKFITNNPYFEISKLILEENTKIDENSILTFEQEEIFKLILKDESLAISARTSFGKTWLIREAFFKKIIDMKKADEIVGFKSGFINFVHIVPNEILVSDITSKISNKISKTNLSADVNIGFPFEQNKNNYLVGTPEKIYPELNRISSASYIISDEAHEMFYLNERSKFYKLTMEFACEHFSETPVILCGAFLRKNDVLKSEIKRKIAFKNPTGFKSLYGIKEENKILLESEYVDFFENENKTTLIYFSTTESCVNAFENEVWKNKNDSVKLINDALDKANNKELLEWVAHMLKKYHIPSEIPNINKRYNVIDGLAQGIGLYHSNMPKEIKMLVYKCAEKGYLKKIFATTAITGGLDIFVDRIEFSSLKVNREEMDHTTFFNIAGRAGRYIPGVSQSIGIVDLKIEKNQENMSWVSKNHDTLFNRKYEIKSILEEQDDYNISKTLQEIKSVEKDSLIYKALIIDPRIHPSISKWFINNSDETKRLYNDFKNLYSVIVETDKKIAYSGMEWIRVDLVKQRLTHLLEKYTNPSVKFKSRAFLHEMKDRDVKIIRYFFKYIIVKNENTLFTEYGLHLSGPNSWRTYSEGMKDISDLFYKEVKYALFSYVNHFLKICRLMNIGDFDLEEVTTDIDANEKNMV